MEVEVGRYTMGNQTERAERLGVEVGVEVGGCSMGQQSEEVMGSRVEVGGCSMGKQSEGAITPLLTSIATPLPVRLVSPGRVEGTGSGAGV